MYGANKYLANVLVLVACTLFSFGAHAAPETVAADAKTTIGKWIWGVNSL